MGAQQVADGVWSISFGVIVNSFVVDAEDGVLVDTGPPKKVTELIGGITQAGFDPALVRHVAITHCHPDHIGGLSRLQTIAAQTSTCVHPGDAAVVRGHVEQPQPSVVGLGAFVARTVGRRVIGHAYPGRVDREVVDGEQVVEGLRVVHTPGHTPGHVSYLWEPGKVLFVGDAAMNMRGPAGPPRTFTQDMDAARSSIARLADLDFELALFGHGKPLADRTELVKLAERVGA